MKAKKHAHWQIGIACLLVVGVLSPRGLQRAGFAQRVDAQEGPRHSEMLSRVTGPRATLESAIARGATATITLQPVPPKTQPPSNYNGSIAGARLTLNLVPARAWFEVQITGWAPQNLKSVQVKLDSTGYLGANALCAGAPANGGDLFPATQSCVTNADCRANISGGVGAPDASQCRVRPSYYPPGGNICESTFQDKTDAQWVLAGLGGGVAGCDLAILNHRCGSTTEPPEVSPDFGPSYFATLVLDVPATAKGLYTIGYVVAETFLKDNTTPIALSIPIAALNPAEVDVSCGLEDCDGDSVVNKDEADPAERDCDRDGICNGVEIANCPPSDPSCADCNGNGIPDECEPDCNGNQIADICDVANCPPSDPLCADCTGNGILDVCETDCNNNQIADSCDIANCPPGNDSCADCNTNGIPDGCEQGGCCLDLNGDGIYEGCSPASSEQSCTQANGVWRGVCRPCPTQNVLIVFEPGGGVFIHVIGPPIDCLAVTSVAARASCPPGGPFYDAWKSDPNASMCHNFGASGQSIPAGFFDPGSDVFAGSLCLAGVPLGVSGFGEADTLIQRSADPFDRCALPSVTPIDVQIDISALSLAGTAPITVTYNGGQNPETWNVTVDRSSVIPPSGVLTATKSHCNGGTYTSVLNVQPRFTFTKVSDPGQIRVLDTGLAGIPYVVLNQQTPANWVQDADPNLGLTGDPCSHFHAGIEDMVQSSTCNCNNNTSRDLCDIENGVSGDCNRNVIPDECDISGGTSLDVDPPNGVPDECDPGPRPLVDPTGLDKARSISFSVSGTATAAASESALRVKLVSLHHVDPPYTSGASVPFTVLEGQVLWVGPPTLYVESNSDPTRFSAAQLQCTPHYRDWSMVGLLHVMGSAIVPSSVYEVENVSVSCTGNEASCMAVSAPLLIPTSRWGDVEAAFQDPNQAASQPDFDDIGALVNKFKSALGAPIKARAKLAGVDARGLIDLTPDVGFDDISLDVDAFKGVAYPYKPGQCTGFPGMACIADADCGVNGPCTLCP